MWPVPSEKKTRNRDIGLGRRDEGYETSLDAFAFKHSSLFRFLERLEVFR